MHAYITLSADCGAELFKVVHGFNFEDRIQIKKKFFKIYYKFLGLNYTVIAHPSAA